MIAASAPRSIAVVARRTPTKLSKALNYPTCSATCIGLRPFVVIQPIQPLASRRDFSSTSSHPKITEFFPAKETERVRRTPAAWPHPIYTEEQMRAVEVAHREAKTWSDKVALSAVKILRWGLDTATGYKHNKPMTAYHYLKRNLFLESVAGVPGMVAGMLRHLHSLRRMKRDNGWIESLLEESYNERMHLLVFLKMMKPGPFMRLMVLGAQGIWCNALFFAYLLSPRTVHRFVGYLEEEAVITYTRQIQDIDAGRLPEWQNLQAPQIAIDYWKMPEGHRTMRDLLLYIRADESKHREVNHTFGNLDQKEVRWPVAYTY
ncbi:alternative oxidase-like protein [Westerdykella ornata]|uniref:Alternative oxidase n=1 Tax=Westerdykella ornata TaxID=318751 RepID=A0A6A6JDD2_WESOR|nr:alternative oxidase-like protein [Westerdykella ornata]KAF2274008.1 alternative oxidase-like protein [Westerdykella ornata]